MAETSENAPRLLFGIAGPCLMFAADQLGLNLPKPVLWVIALVSIVALLIATVIYVINGYKKVINPMPDGRLKALAKAGGVLVLLLLAVIIAWTVLDNQPKPNGTLSGRIEQTKPTIDSVNVNLVVTDVIGDDADGYFELQNNAAMPLKLGAIQQQVPGHYLATVADGLPRTVPAKRKLTIPLPEDNNLAQIGSVRLQFDYHFGDDVKANDPAFVQFDLPRQLTRGSYQPSACCANPSEPFDEITQRETEAAFLRSVGRLDITLDGNNGVQFIATPSRSRQFVFNWAEREAVFTLTQKGRQKVLRSNLKTVPSKQHFFELRWNDTISQASMTVDGEKAYQIR